MNLLIKYDINNTTHSININLMNFHKFYFKIGLVWLNSKYFLNIDCSKIAGFVLFVNGS